MKNPIIVLLLLLLNSYILADTNIPAGNVSGIWTQSGSPYLIEGEITIPNGETLSIDPGCLIEFQGHYKLNVQGRLFAVGTEAEKIHFIINDTTGFSNPYSDDGSWHGIRFEETPAENDSSYIINCILEYGKARGSSNNEDSHGGAIHIRNFSKVRISHSIIRNNRAYYGGGIYCREASPIITDNVICDNIANSGGGLNSLQSYPTIQSNIFIRNYTYWSGGAIHWNSYNTYNELILINNLISENVTEGSGGGINCGRSLQNGQMINNTICNNSAEEGGGIQFYYINCDIINCILYGNTATANGNQVNLYDNSSDPNLYYCNVQGGFEDFGVHGSIIYEGEYENNIDLDPCFTMNNDHPYSLLAESYCINNGCPDISNLNLPDTDLAGNARIYEGDIQRIDIGAYEFQGEPSFVSFLYFYPGPGYFLLPQDVEITCETPDVTIYYTLDGSEPDQNSLLYTAPIQISEVTTVLAKAYKNGLTPSFTEGGTYYIGYNYFHGEISGIWSSEYSPYYIIGDVTIPNGETLTIEPGVDVIFMGHYRFNVQGKLLAEGFENNMITFTINDNTGFNNIDICDGGWNGIRFDNTPTSNDSSRIVYCNIKYGKGVGEENEDGKGGGLYLKDYSKVLISHCLIDSNKAFWNGAGIFCYNSSPLICYNTIRENESISGSGIFTCINSSPLIYENDITYNTTRCIGSGAGICVGSGNAIITKNTITHNTTSGGGIYAGGAGGITCYGSSYCQIIDNILEYNYGGFGGALDVSGNNSTSGQPIITNNMIRNNYGSYAGGLYCTESGMVLVNNEISNNHSYYGGGIGIYWDADPLIINNTITGNTATYGGGLYMTSNCSPTIINTILWDNSGHQIYLRDHEDGEADPDFYYCDIQGGIEDIGVDEVTVYVGNYQSNIDADPCFMGSGLFPFSLDFNSPCINAAQPDTSGLHLPEIDMAALPRIYAGEVTRLDMGAYEYQGESVYTAMPEFSIEPGIYECSQRVELSCLNPEADIYYTLDGSEPDQNSLFYNTHLNITTNTMIRSKAYQTGLQPSMILTGSFFIGILSGNVGGTLVLANSPYNITTDIQIQAGDTLCIDPGVELLFHGHYKFTVGENATLLALGTESEYITFKGAGNYKWHHLVINDSEDDDIVNYCVFTSGKAYINEYLGVTGGAICISNSSPTISNCIIYSNSASLKGGAIYLNVSYAKLIGNLIYDNEAVYGGGIYCFQSSPLIINNTICHNMVEEYGGGLSVGYNSYPIQINVILWGNIAGSGDQVNLYTNYSQPDFYYCNIQGGTEEFGLGNNVVFEGIYENCINAYPQFIDINLCDYHLAASSPCIDSGTPSCWLVPPNFEITIDDLLGYNYFGSNYDIGCYEWLGVGVSNGEMEIISFSLNNYPNPFNPSGAERCPTTTISFSIPEESKVEIIVYNIKGQQVKEIAKNVFEKGYHTVVWHGDDESGKTACSGVYFYTLNVNGKTEAVKKCLLLK